MGLIRFRCTKEERSINQNQPERESIIIRIIRIYKNEKPYHDDDNIMIRINDKDYFPECILDIGSLGRFLVWGCDLL